MYISQLENKDTQILIGGNTVPNKGKSFERSVKILTYTVTAGLAYLFYANYIKPFFSPVPLEYYPGYAAYIQNARMCAKGYELTGCENGVYCVENDPVYLEKYRGTILPGVCVNKLNPETPFLENSRREMKGNLRRYMESRDIFERIYDAVLDIVYPDISKVNHSATQGQTNP
jgi:hypothetical protein